MDNRSFPQESLYSMNSWFNCLDLATGAWGCADSCEKERLIHEAFTEALGAGGPNRIVSVSSGPLKVVAAGGDTAWLEVERMAAHTGITREKRIPWNFYKES